MRRRNAALRQFWFAVRQFLRPTHVKGALLLPGVAFILLELFLEPQAVVAGAPGLLVWAIFSYLLASLALALRQRGGQATSFRSLLLVALLLVALDQLLKLLVLRWLPLEQTSPLVRGVLALRHVHNLRSSWLAVELGLDFIGAALLIGIALLFTALTLSIYRYYLSQRGAASLWVRLACTGFVAAMLSVLVDLLYRGFTVDFLDVAGLVVADFKDVYLDVAIAALFAEIAENATAARRMSTRQTLAHVKRALQLSAQELKQQVR